MGLWEDVRFAGRLLLKDKWFALVAAIALALGIGVNATVFTFVNAVLIRGLPYEDSHQILHVDLRNTATGSEFPASWPEYQEWKALLHHFYDPFPEVDHYPLPNLADD